MTVRWGEKRYYSLDYYLKTTYGEKLYKISLDGGMTCPNRDGTLGTRGCIFCSRGGSGDFAENHTLSVTEQIESGKKQSAKKYTGSSYIAYFQAYTNTYASLAYLDTTSTKSAPSNNSTVTVSPRFNSVSNSLNSAKCFLGVTPAFLK